MEGGDQVSRNIPRYTQRAKGGGLRRVDHEMFRDLLAVISMHISEPQSLTVPMYIAFWQLHSHLYLEKSRVIWDIVVVVVPGRAVTCVLRAHIFLCVSALIQL